MATNIKHYSFVITCLLCLNVASYAKESLDVCALQYPSFSNVVKKLTPTVVNISTTQLISNKRHSLENFFSQLPKNSPFEHFFKDFFHNGIPGSDEKRAVTSLGSGFIISEDGYIVTNNHVVKGADSIDIKFNDGQVSRAKIIGTDEKSDLALLKVEMEQRLPYVTFGDSDVLEVGDWIIAIGNPFGLGGTVTAGIISARGRNISDGSNTDFIQTDAAINRGNSGGPMFDSKGMLIGINTAIFSNSGGNIGIGFAIPSQTALPIINQLKEKGHVVRGWLGVNIQYVTPAMAEALGLDNSKGAYVVGVAKDSPAEKAGIKIDDLIISFDDHEISDMYILPRVVSGTKINKKVNIIVLRKEDNEFVKKKLIAKITQFDDENTTNVNIDDKDDEEIKYKEYLGYKLSLLTDELRDKYDINKDITGIVVTGFSKDSQNRSFTIQEGDVINKVNQIAVKTLDDFIDIVEKNKASGRQYILLSVKRGDDSTLIITLNIDNQ